MAAVMADPATMIFWGGKNDDPTSWDSKWDHDLVVNISTASRLEGLEEPEHIIPLLFGADLAVIKKTEIYDKVWEYTHNDITIEVGPGRKYSIFRVFGKVNYDELAQRLKTAGMTERKPNIEVRVPDSPLRLTAAQVNGPRFDYSKEKTVRDEVLLKSYNLSKLGRAVLTSLLIGGATVYILIALLVTSYKPIELSPASFIGTKGEYVAFNVEGRFILFKFDEDVAVLGVDENFTFWVQQDKDIFGRDGRMRRRIVVDQIVDPSGAEVYRRGNRIVDFSSAVTGYELVRSSDFEFDSYRNRQKPDGDWAKYFEPSRGLATAIVFTARPFGDADGYALALPRGTVLIGELSDIEANQWHAQLADAESYLTALYAMQNEKVVNIFGQITRTLDNAEGRNRKERRLFAFKVAYVRER